jgi:hypothetical protein
MNGFSYDPTMKIEIDDYKLTSRIMLGIVVVAIGWYVTQEYGQKIPGSLLERNEYRGCFFVQLYRAPDRVKSYRIPATIRAKIKQYYIESAHWPNGGITTFSDPDPIYLNGFASVTDDAGNEWDVVLSAVRAPFFTP